MNDINNISLTGRLTADAAISYTTGGTACGKFSIAVSRSVKSNNEWKNETDFFDCQLWGKQAEALYTYLRKGQKIAISGDLRQNRWEQDGQKKSRIVVNVSSVVLCGGKSETKAEAESEYRRAELPETAEFEDDIPF